MATVATYREAYRECAWALCDRHAADTPDAAQARELCGIGPLGPVQHGQHQGVCDVCSPRND